MNDRVALDDPPTLLAARRRKARLSEIALAHAICLAWNIVGANRQAAPRPPTAKAPEPEPAPQAPPPRTVMQGGYFSLGGVRFTGALISTPSPLLPQHAAAEPSAPTGQPVALASIALSMPPPAQRATLTSAQRATLTSASPATPAPASPVTKPPAPLVAEPPPGRPLRIHAVSAELPERKLSVPRPFGRTREGLRRVEPRANPATAASAAAPSARPPRPARTIRFPALTARLAMLNHVLSPAWRPLNRLPPTQRALTASVALHLLPLLALITGGLMLARVAPPAEPDNVAQLEWVPQDNAHAGATDQAPSMPDAPQADAAPPDTAPPPLPPPLPAPMPLAAPPPPAQQPPSPPAPAQPASIAQKFDAFGVGQSSGTIPARPDERRPNRPPHYPESARENDERGQVLLLIHIAADGHVSSVSIEKTSGYPSLDHAAQDAASHWHFKAAMREGKAVDSDFPFNVIFDLTDRRP